MPAADARAKLIEALEGEAAGRGVDIVDVEVVGATKLPTVRVRIDHADPGKPPISLDEVAQNNSWISDAIDGVDPFPGPYTLEVSSPGLARPLRRPKDFERFEGEQVTLETNATEGRRRYSGRLAGTEGPNVRLEVDGEVVSIPFDQVKRCKLNPTIDFSKAAKADGTTTTQKGTH